MNNPADDNDDSKKTLEEKMAEAERVYGAAIAELKKLDEESREILAAAEQEADRNALENLRKVIDN